MNSQTERNKVERLVKEPQSAGETKAKEGDNQWFDMQRGLNTRLDEDKYVIKNHGRREGGRRMRGMRRDTDRP